MFFYCFFEINFIVLDLVFFEVRIIVVEKVMFRFLKKKERWKRLYFVGGGF